MLRSSLKNLLSEEKIISVGINPEVRAETLSISDFEKLAVLLREAGR
jgi:16S rRNA A1518/A1519 N6-dimethyltransferase RsmA/KsgA/DIM1 with predicted DNA glycosylase/AP lyase activity